MTYKYQTRVQLLFWIDLLVKWTFDYLAAITWPIWPSRKENTQLRIVNNWPMSLSTNILLLTITVHWGGCAESHWCWRTTRFGPFLYTNSQHSCSTVLKTKLWFYLVSVVLCKSQNITSWISYYCSYKHNLMLQHFKEIISFFFISNRRKNIIRIIIHISSLKKVQ